jgi:hypothetical protein
MTTAVQAAERLHGDEEPWTDVDREQQAADKFRNERGHEQIELQSLCGVSEEELRFPLLSLSQYSPSFSRPRALFLPSAPVTVRLV